MNLTSKITPSKKVNHKNQNLQLIVSHKLSQTIIKSNKKSKNQFNKSNKNQNLTKTKKLRPKIHNKYQNLHTKFN